MASDARTACRQALQELPVDVGSRPEQRALRDALDRLCAAIEAPPEGGRGGDDRAADAADQRHDEQPRPQQRGAEQPGTQLGRAGREDRTAR